MTNQRVVVVGGAGFIGSHLVDHLIETGNEVLVIDNLSVGKKEFINPAAKFQHFDVTGNENELREIIAAFKTDYLFNYVAEPYIPVSFKRPLYVFNVTAFAAMKVINAAHEAGVKKILQVSSAEIYGAKESGKAKEDEPVIPHSSYGVSKMAVDAFVQVRWREAGTPAIAMRQFNCVGPRETHPYVIPEIIAQIAAQGPTAVVRLGNNSFRDFLYVKDAVRMAVELLEKGEPGEVYNMGSEGGARIYDLAVMIGSLMGKSVEVVPDPERVRPWEIWHLQSDNSKLFSAIEARPEFSLEQALKETIEYYKTNGNQWDF